MASDPNVRRRINGKRPPPTDDVLPLHTLVINLDRRKDRWEGISNRLEEFQASPPLLSVHRFQATDGLTDEVPLDAVGTCWNTSRNAKFDGRQGYRADVELQMTHGERGCAMSHVRAWRIVAGRITPVLVMEDDAVPTKSFGQRLRQKLPEAAALGADVLYLGHIPGAPWRQKKKPGLYEAEYLWTTVAYVLWPHGAKKLLELLPVDEPVDNFMGWQMAQRKLFALAIVPEIVKQELPWDQASDVPHSDDIVLDSTENTETTARENGCPLRCDHSTVYRMTERQISKLSSSTSQQLCPVPRRLKLDQARAAAAFQLLAAMEPRDVRRSAERRRVSLAGALALCGCGFGFFGAFVMPSQPGLRSPLLSEEASASLVTRHARGPKVNARRTVSPYYSNEDRERLARLRQEKREYAREFSQNSTWIRQQTEMGEAADLVAKLKDSIAEHFKDAYAFDPHFIVVAVGQRYLWSKSKEEGSEEEGDLTHLGLYLIGILAVHCLCLGIQVGLLCALVKGHVFYDLEAEQDTVMFKVASFCAIAAFVAEATNEWKELFHLWEIAEAGLSRPYCFAFSFAFAILPKFAFASCFTFFAPFSFLDARRKTDVILNCTGLLFLLMVDNQLFKALGGELTRQDLEALADRVQKYHFPIDQQMIPSEEELERRYTEKRMWQRIKGFIASVLISVAGAWLFWNEVANWKR
eukprot:s469_g23.t2